MRNIEHIKSAPSFSLSAVCLSMVESERSEVSDSDRDAKLMSIYTYPARMPRKALVFQQRYKLGVSEDTTA